MPTQDARHIPNLQLSNGSCGNNETFWTLDFLYNPIAPFPRSPSYTHPHLSQESRSRVRAVITPNSRLLDSFAEWG